MSVQKEDPAPDMEDLSKDVEYKEYGEKAKKGLSEFSEKVKNELEK